jgi:hypothetical protein
MADSQAAEAVSVVVRPAPPPAPAADPAWKVSALKARAALKVALCAVAALIAMGPLATRFQNLWPLTVLVVITAGCFFLLAGAHSMIALVRMGLADGKVGAKPPLEAFAVAGGVGLMAAFGVFVAFLGTFGMARGRQLRKRGKVLLPPLGPAGDWARLGLVGKVPADVREAVAAQWRENGRTEHASVAAFARLTMDLMALGAPPELICSANLDARDEIRHTELCFSLAKALDGRDGGPGPFPDAQSARALPSNRTLALAQLAVDSLIDGALHEGLSARILAQLARRCEEPATRSLLLELAADEGRHSAHGWDAVKWCLDEGGAPVAHALRAAAAMLPEEPATVLPPAARDGSWEAFGIHGAALEAEQYRRALASLTRRVAAMTEASAPELAHA